MKGISILGSTGSIGRNTLKVVDHLKTFKVVGLAAGRNVSVLAEQVRQYAPEFVSCATEECAEQLGRSLHGLEDLPKIYVGTEGLEKIATLDAADIVMSATVGAVGFVPTLRAIEAGKRIALANKETLVMAGELMTRTAEKCGAEILPVDSEHNAHSPMPARREGVGSEAFDPDGLRRAFPRPLAV